MSHNDLASWYKTTYALTKNQKLMTHTELCELIPYEIDLYMRMIDEEIQKQQENELQEKLNREALEKAKW